MVVQFVVFLILSTLICQGTDISKCFSEFLGIRDNESRLYVKMLTFRVRTADVSYFNSSSARDVRRIKPTAAFSLCRFLASYCFKIYLASFSRYKTRFLPNIMPLKPLNKTKLTQNV